MVDLKKKFEEKILAYALKNAIEHEGKCQPGSILSSLFHEGLEKGKVKEIMPLIQETTKKVNSLSLEEQKKQFEKEEKEISHRDVREEGELPELPNVPKSGVIMRFAPSPSGQLHIGHIISNMPSSLYVKKYRGKFYIRIEDTNPESIDVSAYDAIKRDCDWLFGNVYGYILQSERLAFYYKYAEKLIEKGSAYVCTCKQEEFKELLKASKQCPCRSLPIKEHQERWQRMLNKSKTNQAYKEHEAVLLFKSDLKHENPALRDFPLARINETKHPKQGNKYRVWPLMNLSVTVDDIEYNMTHIIRGKDHKDNAERQKMIYKVLGSEKKFPVTLFMGRIKFTDIEMSKRKIKEAIEKKLFEGWNDIRLPTINILRLRGYEPEAFAEMTIQRGISEVDKVLSRKDYFDVLDNFNRKVLKDKSIQVVFVQQDERRSVNKAHKSTTSDINTKYTIEILMPDNTKVKGNSDLDIKKLKDTDIVYFSGLGYCRYNPKEKVKFWFCHA